MQYVLKEKESPEWYERFSPALALFLEQPIPSLIEKTVIEVLVKQNSYIMTDLLEAIELIYDLSAVRTIDGLRFIGSVRPRLKKTVLPTGDPTRDEFVSISNLIGAIEKRLDELKLCEIILQNPPQGVCAISNSMNAQFYYCLPEEVEIIKQAALARLEAARKETDDAFTRVKTYPTLTA